MSAPRRDAAAPVAQQGPYNRKSNLVADDWRVIMELTAKGLSHGDLPYLLDLCLGNPQYYAHLGTAPSLRSLAAELSELPPGCSNDQKSYLGYFDADDALVAALDLIRGFPDDRCAFIGFFMVDSSRQRQGVGSRIVDRLLDRLHDEGFRRVRLGYVEGNEQSRRFWERCGFAASGSPVKQGAYAVVPMERVLDAQEGCGRFGLEADGGTGNR